MERELSIPSLSQLKLHGWKKLSTIPTDMAYLCGYNYKSSDGCRFFVSDSFSDGQYFFSDGYSAWSAGANDNCYAVRPTLELSSELFEQLSSHMTIGDWGIKEVNYGDYPQQAVAPSMQKLMERELSRGTLRETKACYVLGNGSICWVYEYFGKRYIRVVSKSSLLNLESGFECKSNDPVWVEISPVTWLVDDDTRILVAKKGLLAGVSFDNKRYNGDFESTLMKKYLDKHMSKDLFQQYNTHKKIVDKVAKVNDKITQALDIFSSHAGMMLESDDLYNLFDRYNFEINKSYDDEDAVSKLYDDMLDELEKFLVEKKEKYNQYNEYYKMMDYILMALDKGYAYGEKDELIYYIMALRSKGLEFVPDSVTVLNKFEDILNNYHQDILDGNTKFKTLADLKKAIRKTIDEVFDFNNSIGLTILDHDASCGKNRLQVLNKYGSAVIATDLAVLTNCGYMYDKKRHANLGLVLTNSRNNNFHVVGFNGESSTIDSYNTCFGCIRPAFSSTSLFPELLTKSVSSHGVLHEVEFGEYPQFAPKAKMQKILEDKYEKELLKETGRSYTLNLLENVYRDFQPYTCHEYEYEGKKYIRIRSQNDRFVSPKLTNGVSYKEKQYVWIEVTPVVWLIDEKTKTFISKYALLAGISFEPADSRGDVRATCAGMFLDKYMASDIFQSTNVNKKNVNYNASEKTYKISAIVEEIKRALSSYYGHEDIMGKVDALISKYNDDIDQTYKIKKDDIVLTTDTVDRDFLYAKLISDLEDILSEIKRTSEKYIEYTKMLDLTKNCISILNGNNTEEDKDDLIKDIVTIKKVVLPFLGDDSKKNEIMTIFTDNEKAINEYLRENEDSKIKQYKTLEEYKLGIRKQLQPYLIDLSTSVRNKDMVNEIKKGYGYILAGLFVKCKDEYINYFLTEMTTLIDTISGRGTSAEKEKMQELLTNKHEFGDDLTKALTMAVSLYKSLYGIVLDIEKREKKQLEHDEYKIDVEGVNLSK